MPRCPYAVTLGMMPSATLKATAVPAALDARLDARTRVETMTLDGDFSWVADRLIAQRDVILARWLAAAAAQPFHAGRPERAVANHIPSLVDALFALLRRTSPP